MVRIGDVAVIDGAAARNAQRTARLPRARQPARLLRRARGGAARRRRGRRPVGARGRRRRPGGDHLRRLAHERVLAGSPTRRSSSTSRTPPTLPGSTSRTSGKHEFGSGPVDRPAARRSTRAVRAAPRGRRGREDPVHRSRPAARATGTDADAVHLSRGGVPTALISIPLRYMHSPVEMVQLDDVQRDGEAHRRRGDAPEAHHRPERLRPLSR